MSLESIKVSVFALDENCNPTPESATEPKEILQQLIELCKKTKEGRQ